METWRERQPVNYYASFSFIKFFTDSEEHIYGDNSIHSVCLVVCCAYHVNMCVLVCTLK